MRRALSLLLGIAVRGPAIFTNRVGSTTVAALLLLCVGLLAPTARAQEKYVVTADDGTLSMYDLATNSLVETIKANPFTYSVAAGPNSRLVFGVGSGYATVADTTIERVIT